MKRLPLRITQFVLLSLAMFYLPVSRAETPKLLFQPWDVKPSEPLKTAPVYVKKDSWHESLRASLEATFAAAVKKDRATRPSGFQPKVVKLTADAKPVRLEFRVDGLERLVFATLGQWPEHGATFFLSPRLFDKQGNSIELKLDSTMVEGKINHRKAKATKQTIDGTTYRGFALAPREVNIPFALSPGEVSFKLDGKYERLDVLVYYYPARKRSAAARGRRLPTDRSPRASSVDRFKSRKTLFDLVARDFQGPAIANRNGDGAEYRRYLGVRLYDATVSGILHCVLSRACKGSDWSWPAKRSTTCSRTAPRPEMAAELKLARTSSFEQGRPRTNPGSSVGREPLSPRRSTSDAGSSSRIRQLDFRPTAADQASSLRPSAHRATITMG